MTTSTDTPTNAAPQLPSATKPPLNIAGWLLTYTNDETDFIPGPVKPQHLAADCDGIAAVVLLCDAVQFTRQTVSQRITHLEAEVARLKQREHICETMDQAEKIALVRALQECAEALGIGDMMEAWRDAEVRRVTAYLVAESEAKIPAMQAAFEERLTLDRANRLLVKRIADLETKCCTLKDLHDTAADERDEWRRIASAYSPQKELTQALKQAKASGDAARKERNELRARLAEIEAQEPVALVETSGDQGAGIGWSGAAQPVRAKLYASPVPAQAAPDGWRLVPVEPTIAMCIAGDSPRMLVDDCTPTPAIYRAMCAAAPEHKA